MKIEAHNLSRSFAGRAAIDALSFLWPKGSAQLVLGPNAAGKSTLLAMISGLMHPTSGSIYLNGAPARAASSRIGLGAFVPGELPRRRTPRQLLDAVAGIPHWDRLQLSSLIDRRVGTLSSGQQARVRLGLALGMGTELLLLDEPLSTLDRPSSNAAVEAVIHAHSLGTTVVIATHLPERWTDLCAAPFPMLAGRRAP